ncbi:MAG: phosphatase PAP2 family protein [Clostridia bacterium]|nr:phosphatase PAP2 family protein [Clostridia bacterium]
MTKETYERISAPLRENERAAESLLRLNQIMTYMGFILYPVLIVMEFVAYKSLCVRSLITAGVPFVLVSVFRYIFNQPRPYEALDIVPLIEKDTKGKSFPSRHVFSIFVIAMCWFKVSPVVGIFLFVGGVFMAVMRVIGGVHYPRDVIAGALIGIISGVIGMYII